MSMLMTISTSIQEIGPLSKSSHYGKYDWEWSWRAIRTGLGLPICPLQCRPGIRANTSLWIPLHLDLIFACLNLFKSFQLQSIAEKAAKRNSIQPELEIRSCDARLRLKKHDQPERKKGKDFFVVIYFATCLSRLRLSRSFTIGFNKVMHPQTGLERLLSLCQFRRNFPAYAQEYSFHSSLRLTRPNLRSLCGLSSSALMVFSKCLVTRRSDMTFS